MEFAYSLSMYSPPVRVRPANARKSSLTNTNSSSSRTSTNTSNTYNFVHGANKHNSTDQKHQGENQQTEEETIENTYKDTNSIEEEEEEDQDHHLSHQRQQQQQQHQEDHEQQNKKKRKKQRIPGRRRPPPVGFLPQVFSRPASHHSQSNSHSHSHSLSLSHSHSRTSSSFSSSSRTSHETHIQPQATSQAQTAQTQSHPHPHSNPQPKLQAETQEHIQQLNSTSPSTDAAAGGNGHSSNTPILTSPPATSSCITVTTAGISTSSASEPNSRKGASAAANSTTSNTSTSLPDTSVTVAQRQNEIVASTSPSATAPPLPVALPSASTSTYTTIASAPLSSASPTSPIADSDRPPASPKLSDFIRSVHLPIFSSDSGYHFQQTYTPVHSPPNRLQKRESHHRHSSSTSNISRTPTSSSQTVAGPSSLVRRKSYRGKHHDAMPLEPGQSVHAQKSTPASYRADSVSGPSQSNHTGVMSSNDNLIPSSTEGSRAPSTASTSTKPSSSLSSKPFIVRNHRTYINEPSLMYPLPVDLTELHRQSMRTLLLFQLFGGPTTAPEFSNKPPSRVLEVGCGSAFWSMMAHRYFAQHGHSSISFTGMDIVPLIGSGLDQNWKPDKDMRWRFVQHDMRRTPFPLPDNEFDLIMVKDMGMSLATFLREPQQMFDEYVRILKPGGVLEFWESDFTIRMLRPHVLKPTAVAKQDSDSDSDDSDVEEDDVEKLGAYVMTNNTPLSAPLNPFLVEYNAWAIKGLDALGISPVPCTMVGPYLLQESDTLMEVRSKRLAVPLSEIRWEREGVGGVVTKDGKSYIDSQKRKGKGLDSKGGGKGLTASQAALRRTALETVVELIVGLEPVLREVSGKSQDEWDAWTGKMMNDLLREGGTSWGECLEVGAWTARKKLNISAS